MPDNSNSSPDFGNMSLDEIFTLGDPSAEQTPQVSVPGNDPLQQNSPTPAPQASEIPAPSEPFLRTQTGTVYTSKEEAERGYAEKDRVIEQLRQQQIALTGYDPISGKPVRVAPQAQEINYALDPEKFYKDLADANSGGADGKPNPRQWAQVMAKWQQDLLAPYMPIISQSAKTMAIQELDKTVKVEGGFGRFIESPEYRQYLSERPLMADAIRTVENNPAAAGQLKELLMLTYEGVQGRNTAQIIAQSRQNIPPTPQQNPPPRPTLSPSTPTPPNISSGNPLDMSTPEGRKAILDQGRARGLDKLMGNRVFGA